MKPPSYSEEALRRQTALVEELTGQTDRGVAIVGTAWVEEAIGEALHNLLDSACQKTPVFQEMTLPKCQAGRRICAFQTFTSAIFSRL